MFLISLKHRLTLADLLCHMCWCSLTSSSDMIWAEVLNGAHHTFTSSVSLCQCRKNKEYQVDSWQLCSCCRSKQTEGTAAGLRNGCSLKIECGTCGLRVPSVNYFCSCANIYAPSAVLCAPLIENYMGCTRTSL